VTLRNIGGMSEDLSSLWSKLRLSEAECSDVVMQEEVVKEGISKGQNCLVGKLIVDRVIAKNTVRAVLLRRWKLSRSISFKVMGENLFLMEFEHYWEKSLVLEGRPWVFDGNLIAIEDYDGITPIEGIDFENVAFWVRMFHLPLACMSKAVRQQLGATVGEVEEVDTNDDGMGRGEFLRVRIKVNVKKPLAQERTLRIRDRSMWITFQYERLPRLCFRCGTISHGRIGCPDSGRRSRHGEEMEMQFGVWLRAGYQGPWQERGRGRTTGDSSEKGISSRWRNDGRGKVARETEHDCSSNSDEDSQNEMDGNSVSYAPQLNEHFSNGPFFPSGAMEGLQGSDDKKGKEVNKHISNGQNFPSGAMAGTKGGKW
jgi:hypothetical protein